MGKPEESEKLIAGVLEKDPGNVRGRFLKARMLLDKKKFEEAGELLDAIIKDQPRHAGALYYRGLVYLAERDQPRAKAALLKAVEYTPGNLKARLALAQIYLAERSSDLALEHLQIVLARDPENYQALVLEGSSQLLKGDEQQARKAFEKAAEIRPGDPAAFYQLATLDRSQRRYDDAVVQLDKVLQLQPGHLQAIGAKVSVYLAQNKPERALSFLDQQLSVHQSNDGLAAVLHEMRGTLLFSQKDYTQSEADFKKALELSPDLAAPYFSLARLYQVTGRTERAISQYQTILDKQPRSIQAYMALGALYDAQGKKAEARNMYEKTLEVNPDFAPAANNLAYMLLQQDENPDRALELARRAKARLPNDPNVSDTLGLALIRKGLYSSAISELNEAAQKLPDNPSVLYHLALAHWKIGESDRALAALNKALKMKKDFPEKGEAEKLLREIKTN